MYVKYVGISLAAVGGRFDGYPPGRSNKSGRIRTAMCCDCPNESTETLFQFCSIQRLTRRHLSDTVFTKECNTQRGGTLSFLRDFSDRSAPNGEEAEKRKQMHVVVLRCAVCTLFEFHEQ